MLEVPGEDRGDRVAMGAGGAEGDGRHRSAKVPGADGDAMPARVPRVQRRAATPAQALGRGWLILKKRHE